MAQVVADAALSEDVLAFLRRALPHFISGKSVEASMRAVLDDDARLVNAGLKRGGSTYFPTPDERGVSRVMPDQTGDVICAQLARTVYARAQVSA